MAKLVVVGWRLFPREETAALCNNSSRDSGRVLICGDGRRVRKFSFTVLMRGYQIEDLGN